MAYYLVATDGSADLKTSKNASVRHWENGWGSSGDVGPSIMYRPDSGQVLRTSY